MHNAASYQPSGSVRTQCSNAPASSSVRNHRDPRVIPCSRQEDECSLRYADGGFSDDRVRRRDSDPGEEHERLPVDGLGDARFPVEVAGELGNEEFGRR